MEDRYGFFDNSRSPSNWGAGSRPPKRSMNGEGARYAINSRRTQNDPINGWFGGNDGANSFQGNSNEPVNHLGARRGFRETSPQLKGLDGLLNARTVRAVNDQRGERGERFQAFPRNPHEPQFRSPPYYAHGRPAKSHHDIYGPDSAEELQLQRDRAELMQKLEQLNYQISRSKETEQRPAININMFPEDRHNRRFQHYDGSSASTSPYDMDPFGSRSMGTTSRYRNHSSNAPFVKEHMGHASPARFELYPRDPFPPHPPGSGKILEDSFDPQFQHHVSPVRVRHTNPNPIVFASSSPDKPGSLASNKSRKHCLAVAGGTPFIVCSNCFNILKLPRRLRIKENNRDKARCGSCSVVICIQLEGKRLMTSLIEDSKEVANEKSLSAVLNNEDSGLSDYVGMKSGDSEQDFSWIRSEQNAISGEERLDVGQIGAIAGFSSSVYSSSKDEEAEVEEKGSPKEAIIERDHLTSPAPEKNTHNSASVNAYENSWKKGERNDKINEDKAFSRKSGSPRASFEDDPETEVEVSASEYPITSSSYDSMDTSKEDDQPRNQKGGRRSFFRGLMKRSAREQSTPEPIIENERAEVTINGHHIPDDVVEQAEALAGPVHPGDYWYDYQSGFWGVMKHPCLGIIPPFIEQFNYPLPTNCSCGNTGIFVNGRQLHQHDLKLLASRGLPTTRNQFYNIDIFGKVIDEDTGEELYDLGKLAPTVIKAGRGFGMRVPKGML